MYLSGMIRILCFAFLAFSTAVSAQKSKPATPVQNNKPIATPQPTANGKIGYVDVESVISQLPEYKQLETKLTETRKKLSDDMFTRQQNFQQAYSNYTQNARDMADTTRTRMEGQLQQMDADMQQFRADAENTLTNTRKLFLGPVYLKLGGVIHDVAVENGFSMILPYRVGNGELLLHTDPALDVTSLVVKKFGAN
jgi:outer membrane protein